MSSKKKSVSVRLSESDIRKVKDISDRLGVKESDLFRYFIKHSIRKLMPLRNSEVKGVDLIPVLLESGADLARYLELDTEQLDEIVISDLKVSAKRVARSDLELLTLSGDNNSYASFKLSALKNDQVDQGNMHSSMKEYFYEKYSTDEKEKEALTRSSGESSINKLLNLEPNY